MMVHVSHNIQCAPVTIHIGLSCCSQKKFNLTPQPTNRQVSEVIVITLNVLGGHTGR